MDKVSTDGLRKTRLGIYVIIAFVGFVMSYSCGCSGSKNEAEQPFDSLVPTMRTTDVFTLISDSGVVKYKIQSPDWYVYDNGKRPYWYFPEGVKFEKLDSLFMMEASVESDTAYYFKNEQLWHLIGNVHIKNQLNESFSSEEMFWDSRKHKIYSDKFIHIEKEDVIIEGIGFESNENLTKYTIKETSGIFPVEDKENVGETSNDTLR